RRRARQEGLAALATFEAGDMTGVDWGGPYDVVWTVEASEHVADKAAFIARVGEVLPPGGVLAVCAWAAAEPPRTAGQSELLARISDGMLCPGLAAVSDYRRWMSDAGIE